MDVIQLPQKQLVEEYKALRDQVEILQKRDTKRNEVEAKLQKTLHELRVHQEELRAQNEELRVAKEEIESLYRKYENLFDFAPIGYFTFDKNGLIKEVNLTGAEMLGYARTHLVEKPMILYTCKSSRERLRSHLREIFKDNHTWTEVQLVKKNGEPFPVVIESVPIQDSSDRVLFCRAAIIDISKRKRAEGALQESEEKYRSLTNDVLDSSEVGMCILNSQFRVIWVNQAYERFFGLSRKRIIGQKNQKIIHDRLRKTIDEPADFYEKLIKVYKESNYRESFEFHLLPLADRQERWLEHRSQPILTGLYIGGRIEHYYDITERKRAEHELKSFTAKLERSNRELQDFASVVSHDLQEPLRKVQSFGALLRAAFGETLTAECHDYLERMQKATQRMQTLIKDLLTYAQVTVNPEPFVPVNLNNVAQEVVNNLEFQIEQVNGLIEIDSLPTIDADPVQMQQLLQNLLSNALKFNSKDTKPVVRIRCQPSSPRVASEPENSCVICVEDNGVGFEEKYLDQIFMVFQRLHGRNAYEGTGIGLATCQRIVHRHNGKITAKSKPGKGSRFIVTLPVKQTFASCK